MALVWDHHKIHFVGMRTTQQSLPEMKVDGSHDVVGCWTTRDANSQHLRQTEFVVSTDTTQSLLDPGSELACLLRSLVPLSDVIGLAYEI